MKIYQDKIFAAIEAACLMEGGDGDTLVVCKDPVKVADNFERYLKENNISIWKRTNKTDIIIFYHDQENIIFTNKDNASKVAYHFFDFYDLYGFLE